MDRSEQLLRMAGKYENLGKIFQVAKAVSWEPEREEVMSKVCFGLKEFCEMLAEGEQQSIKMKCTECGFVWKPKCNRPFRAKHGKNSRILRSLKRCPRCHKRAEVFQGGD